MPMDPLHACRLHPEMSWLATVGQITMCSWVAIRLETTRETGTKAEKHSSRLGARPERFWSTTYLDCWYMKCQWTVR